MMNNYKILHINLHNYFQNNLIDFQSILLYFYYYLPLHFELLKQYLVVLLNYHIDYYDFNHRII